MSKFMLALSPELMGSIEHALQYRIDGFKAHALKFPDSSFNWQEYAFTLERELAQYKAACQTADLA